MRLSELIKSKQVPGKHPDSALPRPTSIPRVPPAPPLHPAKDFPASEKQIRDSLENDFRLKLEKVQDEINRLAQEKIKEDEKKFKEHEKAFQKENQKLSQQLQEFQANNLALQKQNENLAQTVKQTEGKLEISAFERMKLEQEVRKELNQTMEKMVNDFQKKIMDQEKAFLIKETKFEEEMTRRVQDRSQPESQVREELAKAQRTIEALNEKNKERPAAPVEVSPMIEQPPAKSPEPVYKEPAALPPAPIKLPPKVEVWNENLEMVSRQLYQELQQAGEKVFEQVTKGTQLNLSELSGVLSKMIDWALQGNEDLVGLFVEAYPDTHIFPYHAANSAILATVMGIDSGVKGDALHELAMAAYLHDIGLVNIRENLDYPKQLTPDMQNEVLKHPQKGASLLEGVVSEAVITAILHHHESPNGKGYPQSLQADEIHLFGKIIQAVDAFEAMTHDRPYRKRPMEATEAIKEMAESRGVYDRDVLKVLMSRVGLYPVRSLVELSNKQIARVIRQNRQFPLSPVVRVEFNEDGGKTLNPPIIDLSKNQLIHIQGSVGSGAPYAKEKAEHHQHVAKQETENTNWFRASIPFILMVTVILLLVFLIMKI